METLELTCTQRFKWYSRSNTPPNEVMGKIMEDYFGLGMSFYEISIKYKIPVFQISGILKIYKEGINFEIVLPSRV